MIAVLITVINPQTWFLYYYVLFSIRGDENIQNCFPNMSKNFVLFENLMIWKFDDVYLQIFKLIHYQIELSDD